MTLAKEATLADLLTHLYVLIPVFDGQKHYFVGEDEMEKLLAKGGGWLAGHPEKDEIARRYLKFRPSLYRQALARLVQEEQPSEAAADGDERPADRAEDALERPLSLNEQRIGAVLAAIRASGARRVLDLGCGEGRLLRELLKDRQFEEVVGMDVSIRSLEAARDRLKLDRLPEKQAAPDQADPRVPDLPGPAAGGVRRRRRGRGGRAPRPAPAGGLRAGRLRVRPAADGRADDAEPRVQRHVGERRGRASCGTRTTASSGPGGSSGPGPSGSPGATATRCGSCRSGRRMR